MTVSDTTVPRKLYIGNGVTVEFSIPFPYNADSANIIVVFIDNASSETTLVENTDYTVSTSTDIVTITDMDYRPESDEYISISRSTPLKQLLDLINNNAYDANLLEQALDLLTLIVQEAKLNAMLLPGTASESMSAFLPTPEGGRALQWATGGTALENGPTSSEISNAQTHATAAQTARTGSETAQAASEAAAALAAANASALTIAAGAVAWDISTKPEAKLSLTETATLSAPSNLVDGRTFAILVSNTGAYNLNFNAIYDFGDQSTPSMAQGSGKETYIVCRTDGTNVFAALAWKEA
jgi:hypothetical protein